MVHLQLDDKVCQNKIVRRLKTSLEKSFKLSSYKDIDKAVCLANYLMALNEINKSKSLLESFVLDVKFDDDRMDLWGSNGQGIILLAYIYNIKRDKEKESSLTKLIKKNDFQTDRCSRYELYLEEHEEHEETMEEADKESQKFKCEIIGQQALTFLYFYEMMPYFEEDTPTSFKEDIKYLIEDCYAKLNKALIN